MSDEYQLRKDIDKLYALVYDSENERLKLVTLEEYNTFKTNTNLNLDSLSTIVFGKQDQLVSGTNIKTINNNSLLGSGNITIQGGGGGGDTAVIGTGSFSIDNNGHLIVELPNGVDNPYYIDTDGHLYYDTTNAHNGE